VCQYGHHIRHIVVSNAPMSSLVSRASAGSNDGVGTNARFNYPSGIALSSVGTFALVADYGNCIIRKVVVSTKVVTRVAGSGTCSTTTINGIGTLATFYYTYTSYPTVSSDDSFAVVSDLSSCIRKIVLSTGSVATLAGSTSAAVGSADGVGTLARFNWLYSVVLTSDDSTAYVLDRYNNNVRRVVCVIDSTGEHSGGSGGLCDSY
jgi:hypothetical protein